MRVGQKILLSEAELNHEGDKNKALSQLVQNIEKTMRKRLGIPGHVSTPTKRPSDAHMNQVPSPRYAVAKKV